jgi:hypothetical protein
MVKVEFIQNHKQAALAPCTMIYISSNHGPYLRQNANCLWVLVSYLSCGIGQLPYAAAFTE